MIKKMSVKLLSVIAAVSILLSVLVPLTAIIAVAEAPALPENPVAVLDENGVSVTVGQYYVWLWDRLFNTTATTDLSEADNIEFDMKSDMYDELKAKGVSTNKNLTLALVSNYATTGNKWTQRHFVFDVFKYETGTNGDWHHFKIPKTAFNAEPGADWAKKDFWMFGFWNGSGATDALGSATIEVKNICGTASYKPSMPDNVVAVIDEQGGYNTISDYYVNLCDRLWKRISPVDISAADYVEFDLYYDDYVSLTRAADAIGLYLTMSFTSSDDSVWTNRMRTTNLNTYASKDKEGWYHFKVPIADFVYVNMGPIDWSAVKTWMIGFEGANLFTPTGDFKNHMFEIRNICATSATSSDIFRPGLTNDAIYVVDQLGILSTMGENAESSYSEISNTFTSNAIMSGNLTASKKIFMNVYVDDIDALPNNLSIAFGVEEGEGYRYLNELDITNQITKDGWNEVLIPIKNIVTDNADDLKNIACWRLSSTDTSAVGSNADCRLWICNIAGTVDSSAADIPENAVVIIDEAGAENTIGAEFAHIYDRLWKVVEPANVSNVDFIEFDLHFDGFIDFSRVMADKKLRLGLHLTSSGKQWENRYYVADIPQYAMEGENGWWHFKIPKSAFTHSNTGEIDWKAVDTWMVGLDGEGMRTSAGEYANTLIKLMNLCGTIKDGTEIFRPAMASDSVSVIDQLGVLGTYGENAESTYDKISDTFVSNTIIKGDLTVGKYISMQVYVDTVRALPTNLSIAFGVKEGEGYRYLNDINIADQILKTGWNEVIIPTSAVVSENEEDLKNIACWRLSSTDTSAVGNNAKSRLWLCNVISIVEASAPDLPKNIIETLNYRGLANAPGYAFSWLADRMYQQKLGPYDISEADYMEFDFYVEDYEAVKTAMEENNMDLVFCISSGDPVKYSNSRYFFRSIGYFFDQVTDDGWNHVKLPIGKMITSGEGGAIDLSSVTSFMLSFMGEDIQGDSSSIAEVKFKIINVCATTELPYIRIEPDADKAAKPDKNAVYINDAEGLFDENGTWNPIAAVVDNKYKTEGTASISNVLFDQTLRSNQLRFIFNETADVSDIDTLKFDFFVSNIDLLKARASMSVVLSSDVRGVSNYYSWKLNLNGLKNGWNSITIDTDKGYTKVGSPDLSKLKAFIVQCDDETFKSDVYVEKVTIKLDNIRYISKTGNTTLKINSDEDFSDFDDFDDSDDDDFDDSVIDAIPEEIVENQPVTAPVETDTRIVKKMINNTVTQYVWMILALVAEVILVAVAITTVYLIKRKKNMSR